MTRKQDIRYVYVIQSYQQSVFLHISRFFAPAHTLFHCFPLSVAISSYFFPLIGAWFSHSMNYCASLAYKLKIGEKECGNCDDICLCFNQNNINDKKKCVTRICSFQFIDISTFLYSFIIIFIAFNDNGLKFANTQK